MTTTRPYRRFRHHQRFRSCRRRSYSLSHTKTSSQCRRQFRQFTEELTDRSRSGLLEGYDLDDAWDHWEAIAVSIQDAIFSGGQPRCVRAKWEAVCSSIRSAMKQLYKEDPEEQVIYAQTDLGWMVIRQSEVNTIPGLGDLFSRHRQTYI